MAELLRDDETPGEPEPLLLRVAAKYDALADAAEADPESLRSAYRAGITGDADGAYEEYVAATVARLRRAAASARERATA